MESEIGNEEVNSFINQLRRELHLPKVNQEFTLNGHRWRVSFVNTGKMRFTAVWLGPVPNVTLDVQSSNSQSQSTVK